ncbi:MAG: rRNA (uracil1939-C5)-methyltransferase [Eubacteriales bacterium]|nr:rRNA (uracil1939-C5)-methyltransferase [Eubacteriales bacterium]
MQVEIEITGIGSRGQGVGRHEGMVVFVPGALPGEVVRAEIKEQKKNFARAELTEVLRPSPHRRDPFCPYFGRCGGCQLQHMSYEAQLAMKERIVRDALERIGRFSAPAVKPVLGMDEPSGYRNKVHYQVGGEKGNLALGFYEEESHRLVALDHCPLVDPALVETANLVKELADEYGVTPYNWGTGEGQLRHLLLRRARTTGEIMVVFVTGDVPDFPGLELARRLMREKQEIVSVIQNVNTGRSRQVLGPDNRILGGRMQIWDRLCGFAFALSPSSFYQVNPIQAEKLYSVAGEYAELTEEDYLYDLYCGVGTIAIILSRRAKKVFGIESVPEAVVDARRNADLNKVRNANFLLGKVEEVLPKMAARRADLKPRVVVLDPPRRGAERSALEVLARLAPEQIIYVSCNPATLARDLRILADSGYSLEEVQPVDMFPWTAHVECVAVLRRG